MSRAMGVLRVAALAATLLPASALAQGLVKVRGIAFDSVANAPLADAFVTLGGVRSTTSDSTGAFTFDSVSAGEHLLEMTHAALDSMGLSGVAARVRVAGAEASVTIAVPSFATLWRAACGARPVPADSGIVYGAVRDSRTGEPLARAKVVLTWTDLSMVNLRRYSQKAFKNETVSEERGDFGFCGVPMDAGLRLQATVAGGASGMLDMGLTKRRILRRDLVVGPTDTSAAVSRGAIEGLILNEAGAPLAGATIVLDDVPQTRSGEDGRFRLNNVLPGTRQVEVMAIGLRPQLVAVDVIAGTAATVSATLAKVTTLQAVTILGSRWQQRVLEELDKRKIMKLGQRVDSTRIERMPTLGAAIATLPGVDIRYGPGGVLNLQLPGPDGGRCTPNYFIDGLRVDSAIFSAFPTTQIALIEAFPRRSQVPPGLWILNNCGAVAIWTKQVVP